MDLQPEHSKVGKSLTSDPLGATNLRISVIIPSWDASRSGNLPLLLNDIKEQTIAVADVAVVERTSPNGHARNVGVARTTGEILIFLDDDVRLGNSKILQTFANLLSANEDLGMVGTSQLLPPDSSAFQLRCADQLSRCKSDLVQKLTESDMVTTQCCAMRRSVLAQVGGFHDKILRGVDPELRNRVRAAGYRIAVAPEVWHYHPMPAELSALLNMAWRDGVASAFARKNYPETVLFNPDGHVGQFEARQSFPRRVVRNLIGVAKNLCTGRWYGTAYGFVYAIANLRESVRARKRA